MVKNPSAMEETQEMGVQFLGPKDPLEKEMAAHSGILSQQIPCTEEAGGLQSMGLRRVGRNLVTKQQQQRLTMVRSGTSESEKNM